MKTLICVLALLVGSSTLADTTLQLARNEKLAEQAVAENLLKDVYKRAGLSVVVNARPPARANGEAIVGKMDGEVARIYSYGLKNPSMVRVEPSYYYLTTAVFAKSADNLTIKTKDDLKSHRVGIIRGVQHSLDATAGVYNVQLVDNAQQLFQMLNAGRFDVALDTGINGRYMLKKLKLQGIAEIGVLAKLDLYHYLHEKNKDQAPAISAVIKKLSDSGELAKMVNIAEKSLLDSGS